MIISLFAWAGLSLGVLCLLLAFIVLAYSKQKVHRLWALFNTVVALWGLGTCLAGLASNPAQAIQSWKIAYLPCTFIAIVFYHLICTFCHINRKKMIIFAYTQGILFLPFIYFSPYFVNSTFFFLNSIHYHIATPLFKFWMAIFVFIAGSTFVELFMFVRRSQGIKKIQALYLFLGMFLGWGGGLTTLLPPFNLNIIYPAWHSTICIYTFLMTYAIFRYQIMDIKIVVTRMGIFVFVYALVLGIPYGLAILGRNWLEKIFKESWFWFPMNSLLILATAGPFIYIYFQRRAEKVLLQEDRRMQELLNTTSVSMITIRNLSKLLQTIIDILAKNLRLDNAAIYLYELRNNQYVLKMSWHKYVDRVTIEKNNPLIQKLEEIKYPLICEEFKLASELKDGGGNMREMIRQMAELQSSAIVPIILEDILLGFIVLGERKDKRVYSFDLINVLSVLGNQAALAIENCKHIQRVQEEGLTERMVSLDHMASSMAHEIDNPMHIVRTSLSFVKSALLRDPRVTMPEEIRQDFDDALARSLNASERVSSMIKAILDYSRMGTGKLETVHIREALEGFLHLIGPQIRGEKVGFTHEIESDLPVILGDRIQMEEVFMNFVRNSLHAVRRNEEKKISLKIFRKTEAVIRIECNDNGYGIPQEIIKDIFLSSMTTKGSSEGTGLGLYRVRKIVDLFRGKVWAESGGKDKGATFIVDLPVYPPSNSTDSRKGG